MGTRKTRRVTARYNWDRLKVSFWFAPAIMALAAVLLAWIMYWVDVRIPNEMLASSHLILAGTPGELRAALISMATTTLATAGVVFTLLTLPLSTVAAQYGSRLLSVFLGDRITQIVLGMFVATFVYCLAAALSIPPVEVEPEGPYITATVGMFLMVATFASLILLIQHISTMLQAPNIAAAVGARLRDTVTSGITDEVMSGDEKMAALVPYATSKEAPVANTGGLQNSMLESQGAPIHVKETGYIQYIDPRAILTIAREKDLVIRLLRKPGHFVWGGTVVAQVWPATRVDEPLERLFRHAFRIGNTRTPTQDIEYAVNQLVEMAVRAMSPAINDPYTAMTCLDYIAEGLALFIQQGDRSTHYYDQAGNLRLVLEPVTFDNLLSAAFDMLRHASSDNASVLLHMLEAIDAIGIAAIGKETLPPSAPASKDRPHIVMARQELLRQVSLIQAESQASRLIEADRQLIQHRCEALYMKMTSPQPAQESTYE